MVRLRGDQFSVPKNSHATTDSENHVEECLAGGARHTVKQRAIVCGGGPFSKSTSRFKFRFEHGRKTQRTEYRTESVIADLSKTGVFDTFSEESKNTVQKLGKIELFELGDVSRKVHCLSCVKYWPEDCYRKNRSARQRNNSRSCQILITS